MPSAPDPLNEPSPVAEDSLDACDVSTADLEASLVASAGVRGTEDEGAFTVWLQSLDARPGRYASVPTADAYVIYVRWAEVHAVEPLAPFTFARRMGGVFEKKNAHYWRAGNQRVFLMKQAPANRLRAMVRERPPTGDEIARFKFAALRVARHPSKEY